MGRTLRLATVFVINLAVTLGCAAMLDGNVWQSLGRWPGFGTILLMAVMLGGVYFAEMFVAKTRTSDKMFVHGAAVAAVVVVIIASIIGIGWLREPLGDINGLVWLVIIIVIAQTAVVGWLLGALNKPRRSSTT